VADDRRERDLAAVHAAHRRFYTAVETADLDEMTALWQPGEHTVCVHPGFGQLRGTTTILRSWALVMAQASYLQYVLTDEVVDLHGDAAVVSCTENTLSAAHGAPVESFDGGRAVATHLLVRGVDEQWRLVARHASPVAAPWRAEGEQ
jgi:ketosteroid isomerase-like protein